MNKNIPVCSEIGDALSWPPSSLQEQEQGPLQEQGSRQVLWYVEVCYTKSRYEYSYPPRSALYADDAMVVDAPRAEAAEAD